MWLKSNKQSIKNSLHFFLLWSKVLDSSIILSNNNMFYIFKTEYFNIPFKLYLNFLLDACCDGLLLLCRFPFTYIRWEETEEHADSLYFLCYCQDLYSRANTLWTTLLLHQLSTKVRDRCRRCCVYSLDPSSTKL